MHELGVAGLFVKPFYPSAVAEFVRNVIGGLAAKGHAPAGGHAF